ncbi:MAG: hypothetical protein DCC59_11605 [Chloroflexi bacterium]|nr:DUF433 domain-containing protein [Chloroflexi bacterium CFX1]MCK6566552.1 DUF433 domain-containing protein [Anaerolineales bacterium]MCQ3954465.1 hypothetical protein [Chloroflexota bacterium]MDL1920472.1 DUF433 domain-containing protein [Chloroflexi bacterium CFX5]NUQ60692.1 DUF433 domain-containing protein [Anaerolineales bacterium]
MVAPTVREIVPIKMNKDGAILVSKTRVTLDTIVGAFNDGATAEEIAHQYPSVPLADIYSVIGYYLRQKKQVDAYLKRRAKQAKEIRKFNEERLNTSGIRERLLARSKTGRK